MHWFSGQQVHSDVLRNAALHIRKGHVGEFNSWIQSFKADIFWCCAPKCMIEIWEQTAEGERKTTAEIRINVLQKSFEFAKQLSWNHRGLKGIGDFMRGRSQTSSVVGMAEDPKCSLSLRHYTNSIWDFKLEFLKMSFWGSNTLAKAKLVFERKKEQLWWIVCCTNTFKYSAITISIFLPNTGQRGSTPFAAWKLQRPCPADCPWTSCVHQGALWGTKPTCGSLESTVQPSLDNLKLHLENSFQGACSSQWGPVHIQQCLLARFLGWVLMW